MLPKINRLTTKQLRHFRGHRLLTPNLHAITAPAGPPTKYAILIKKSLVSKAHDRNRLRRLIFNHLQPSLNEPPSHHTLIILQPKGAHAPDAVIINDLEDLLSKILNLKS